MKTITEIRLSRGSPIHTLYWRPVGASQYVPFHQLSQGQSLENAVNCGAAWIFARLQTWAKTAYGYGSISNEVVRIDLTGNPRIETLALTDILSENAKVRWLLRSNDLGTGLQAVLSFLEPYDDSSGHRVRHAICDIDLVNRSVTEMDTLPGMQY